MASKIELQDVGYIKVTGGTGASTAARGDIASARTGAGIYTLTLGGGGVDLLESIVEVTPHTANIIAQIVHTTDLVKTVNTFLGSTGAATDSDFTAVVRAVKKG